MGDGSAERLALIPRTGGKEINRTKGYGVRDRVG
jgi:hypothetical protein